MILLVLAFCGFGFLLLLMVIVLRVDDTLLMARESLLPAPLEFNIVTTSQTSYVISYYRILWMRIRLNKYVK